LKCADYSSNSYLRFIAKVTESSRYISMHHHFVHHPHKSLCSKVSTHYNEEAERLVIGVSDHGQGLSSSEQARIFGLFQRLENKRPDQARGAGLGLMICRRLVEAHGG